MSARNLEIVDDRVGVPVLPEDGVERLDLCKHLRPVRCGMLELVLGAQAGRDEVQVVVLRVRDRRYGVVVGVDLAP